MRHGHVADHQGDVALLPEGKRAAFQAGLRIADRIADQAWPEAALAVGYGSSARTRETAEELARGMESGWQTRGDAVPPILLRVEPAIRNFHFILNGKAYPPTDAMHESLPPEAVHNPYLQQFWSHTADDPIGYWLNHPDDSAERPDAVAARLRTFFISLLERDLPRMHILVTHSGPMRAFLREALGNDPGEPDYCEAFQVNENGVSYRDRRGDLIRPSAFHI